MARRVLVQRSDERFHLVEVKADSELSLQEVLRGNPQLIPADDLGFEHDLLVVGRETALASGYVDLLCLASTGDLVIVELKTGKQNPDFRHALAQVIDYGSDLWKRTLTEFDHGVVQAYLDSRHADRDVKFVRSLRELIGTTDWGHDEEALARLESRLQDVLSTGDFLFVVVAQAFTDSMRASVEYLNETRQVGRFYLVELIELRGSDLVAHQAQVVTKPATRGGSAGARQSLAGEAAFLASLTNPTYRDALQDLLARCRVLGLTFEWGVRGSALRLAVKDTKEPLSVGWILGDVPSWGGLTHPTLGVDRTSLSTRPSAAPAVTAYVAKAQDVPGAKSLERATLAGATFTPEAVLAQREAITELIEELVSRVNETESSGQSAALERTDPRSAQ